MRKVKYITRYDLNLPVQEEEIKNLKISDIIYLNGVLITARDQAHKRIMEYIKNNKVLPESFQRLKGSAIYHCGPIIKELNQKYEIISGGPTTSERMLSENEIVKFLGIRFIIGKGGMTNLNTKENMVVYLSFTGGCGAIVNQKIEKITRVEWIDLGKCEAVWFLKVKEFGPLIVAQANGRSLYKK